MAPAAEPDAGSPTASPDGALLAALRRAGQLLQRVPRGRAWLPLGLWMALIWTVSSITFHTRPGLPAQSFLNNLGHAPLFGLLALWAALGLPRERGWPRLDRRAVALVLAGVLAWGVIDELHQGSVPGRDVSVLDLLTDLTGAACVLWVARYAGRPEATSRGATARLGAGLVLCASAAAVATWLPVAFGGVGWM